MTYKVKMFVRLMRFLRRLLWRITKEFKIIIVIYFLQFVVILPVIFWDKPWTVFFKYIPSTKDYSKIVSDQNTARLVEASEYFNAMNANASLKWYDDVITNHKDDLDIVVTIVTTKRKTSPITHVGLGYLKQTSAKVDKLVKEKTRAKSILTTICNVDSHPSQHDDAMFLKSYLHYVERFGESRPSVPDAFLPNSNKTYRTLQHDRTLEKETYDYMFCLNSAKRFNPKYVLMLEDDGVPHSDLLDVIEYELDYRLDTGSRRKFVHLKLFYPDKWQGYAFELYRLIELISTGLVGGTIFILFHVLANLYPRPSAYYSLVLFYVSGVIFIVLTCLVVGRQNVMELRRVSPPVYRFIGSPKCCTPAMLFPTNVIEELSLSLSRDAIKKYMRTDLAIAHYVETSGIPAFHIEPNLVYHIGTKTSLGILDKPAQEFLYNVHI